MGGGSTSTRAAFYLFLALYGINAGLGASVAPQAAAAESSRPPTAPRSHPQAPEPPRKLSTQGVQDATIVGMRAMPIPQWDEQELLRDMRKPLGRELHQSKNETSIKGQKQGPVQEAIQEQRETVGEKEHGTRLRGRTPRAMGTNYTGAKAGHPGDPGKDRETWEGQRGSPRPVPAGAADQGIPHSGQTGDPHGGAGGDPGTRRGANAKSPEDHPQNRLASHQMDSKGEKLRAQITEMDGCYKKFQKHLASIHKEQSEAYRELRDQTVKQLEEAIAKQKETMDEMKAASNLIEEPNTEVPEPPVPSDQPWAITESEEEEPMETTEKKKRGLSRDALRPFGKRHKAEEKEQEAEL